MPNEETTDLQADKSIEGEAGNLAPAKEPEEAEQTKQTTENNDEEPTKEAPLSLKERAKAIDVAALDEKTQDDRDEIQYEQQFVTSKLDQIKNKYPAYSGTEKPIYDMSDEDFDDTIDGFMERTDVSDADKIKLVLKVRKDRKAYLSETKPLREAQTNINAKTNDLWLKEWKEVENALTDEKEGGAKELKEFIPELSQALDNNLKNQKYLFDSLQSGGVKQKLKYAIRLMETLGIDKKVEAKIYGSDRPEAAAPVGQANGSKSPKNAGKVTFTPAQIDKMSPQEYDKNRSAIMDWQRREAARASK